MYVRDCIAQEFYIEEHAVLYALLVKHATDLYGQAGWDASIQGTILYGAQRGARMARRALADHESLTPENYLLYGEWSDHLSWSRSKVVSLSPYRTLTTRCGWCDSWNKHGLMTYGKLYCTYIDQSLVKGFHPDNRLELNKNLSHGEDCCDFTWVGAQFDSSEELEAFERRRAALAPRTTRDFLYHTGHLLNAMTRAYANELSDEAAEKIQNAAISEFTQKFGESKREALIIESQQDFDGI